MRSTNRRGSNIRKSYHGSENEEANEASQSTSGSQKIPMKSEDHYYDEDDDAVVLGAPQKPKYSDSGSEEGPL